MKKIVPVIPDANGRIVARAVVRGVYDTNALGELIPIPYRQNPMDGVEVKLVNAPYAQVYVEIYEEGVQIC